MMKAVPLVMLLALAATPAVAQEQSCTFVFNRTSKKVDMTCNGMPHAPLDVHDRAALSSGKVKVCVVRFDPRKAGESATKQAPRPGWVTTCK